MSKKRPRKKDPHSWIRDTTKESPETLAAAGAAEPDEEEELLPESTPRRYVIVEYQKEDGRIVAAHNVSPAAGADVGELPPSSSEDRAVARLTLIGEMLDKTLLDLYGNYRVDVSKKRPALAPKG